MTPDDAVGHVLAGRPAPREAVERYQRERAGLRPDRWSQATVDRLDAQLAARRGG